MAIFNMYNNGTPIGLTYEVLQQSTQPTVSDKNILWIQTGAKANPTIEENFVGNLEPELSNNYSFNISLDDITDTENYYILPEENRTIASSTDVAKYNKTLIDNKNIYYRHRAILKQSSGDYQNHYFCIAINLQEIETFAFGYNGYDNDPEGLSENERKKDLATGKFCYFYPNKNGNAENKEWGYVGTASNGVTPLDVSYVPDSGNPQFLYIYFNRISGKLLPSSKYLDFILSYKLKESGKFPVSIERIDKETNQVLSIVMPKNNYGSIEIPSSIVQKDGKEVTLTADKIFTNFRDTGLNPSALKIYSFTLQKSNTYKIQLPDSIKQRAISKVNEKLNLNLSHLTGIYTPEQEEQIIFSITQSDLDSGVFKDGNTVIKTVSTLKSWIEKTIENCTINYKIIEYYKNDIENSSKNNKTDYYISPTDPRLHTPKFMKENEIGGPLWIVTSDNYTPKNFNAIQGNGSKNVILNPEAVLKYLDLKEFKEKYDNTIPFNGVWFYLPAKLYIAELKEWFNLDNKIGFGINAISVNGELLTNNNGVVNINLPSESTTTVTTSSYSTTPIAETPFYKYNFSFKTKQNSWQLSDGTDITERTSFSVGTNFIPCPRYLGFQCTKDIADSENPYIYIGTLNAANEFKLDKTYIFNETGSTNIVLNRLDQNNNQFIEIQNYQNKVFYVICPTASQDYFEVIGGDTFDDNTDTFAITPTTIKNDQGQWLNSNEAHTVTYTESNYSSILLPSNCYYVILNKTSANYKKANDLTLSYDKGSKTGTMIKYPPAFGRIPDGAIGSVLLHVPDNTNNIFDDIAIYTSIKIETSSNSGQRRKAKKFAKDIVEKFKFKIPDHAYENYQKVTSGKASSISASKSKLFSWDGRDRKYAPNKNYHGIPYSSRWQNSHFVGFEISPETAANALNDPYSVAYDGATYARKGSSFEDTTLDDNTYVRRTPYNAKGTECSSNGGPGYGLVCGAFALLIHGNSYPQTNRGFTYDKNFIIEHTDSISAGDILVNNKFSHVVTVDETYNNGYSLIEARGPCTMKTIHTNNLEDNNKTVSYLGVETNLNVLDTYPYKIQILEKNNQDKAIEQFNTWFNNPVLSTSPIQPWRGNKAVYGPWDLSAQGTGISATIKNPKDNAYTLYYVDTKTNIHSNTSNNWDFTNDFKAYINQRIDDNKIKSFDFNFRDDTNNDQKLSYFRYYHHDPVKLCLDSDGRVSFVFADGTPANNIEYAYIDVKGYGGIYNDIMKKMGEVESGPIVVAAGQCYPDLLKDGEITKLYAAIARDTQSNSWGKYSCCFVDYENINNSIIKP